MIFEAYTVNRKLPWYWRGVAHRHGAEPVCSRGLRRADALVRPPMRPLQNGAASAPPQAYPPRPVFAAGL